MGEARDGLGRIWTWQFGLWELKNCICRWLPLIGVLRNSTWSSLWLTPATSSRDLHSKWILWYGIYCGVSPTYLINLAWHSHLLTSFGLIMKRCSQSTSKIICSPNFKGHSLTKRQHMHLRPDPGLLKIAATKTLTLHTHSEYQGFQFLFPLLDPDQCQLWTHQHKLRCQSDGHKPSLVIQSELPMVGVKNREQKFKGWHILSSDEVSEFSLV